MFRFSAIILLIVMQLPLFAGAIRQKQINRLKYSNLYDLMTGNNFRVTLQPGAMTAVGRGYTCVFNRNARRMSCNGIRVELLNSMSFEGNLPWISTLDWFKTLRPLLYPGTVPKHHVRRIMIDMGHGGNDSGARGAISQEKAITLKTGQQVARILRARGYQVDMTRTSDIQIPLDRIGPMQQRTNGDLFVSIHVNSAADKKVTGIETYCLTPAGAASSNGGKISQTIHDGNRNDPANFLLAWHIQNALLRRTGAIDRGIKRARFAVLKNIHAPGVLVEIGFISNQAEERKLNDPEYINKIALGIVEGIDSFARTTGVRR
ncbi:MAG: N-acetylmuramoyl-L-alanine amidase [Lentisphaeria bacterium]|nr:N-acetylmuramoyl-L-alanine amidase [Lentisphaeria bacterium]